MSEMRLKLKPAQPRPQVQVQYEAGWLVGDSVIQERFSRGERLRRIPYRCQHARQSAGNALFVIHDVHETFGVTVQ